MISDTKPGRGSERVKAWVYAILNPLIDSLRRERELLKTGNLSWRAHTRRFEYIRPIVELIDVGQRPNLEDLSAEYPPFPVRFREHDSAVAALEQATTVFVKKLLTATDFEELVSRCVKKYASTLGQSKLTYPDLSEMHGRIPDYIAEFIVNNTMFLPEHYTLYYFWVEFAGQFQAYFEGFGTGATAKAKSELLKASDALGGDLEALRLKLCREYDIPAAPIEPPRNSSAENVLFR